MKSFVLESYGGAECTHFAERELENLGALDLKIKVVAAGLNPVDSKAREGKLKLIYSPKLPAIMGNELSGEVIAIGPEVTKFKCGDKIIARTEKGRWGAFAEYACADESVAALAPKTIALEEAAALPLAGLTALQALRDELGASTGKHILITGGAGGVGTLAIQIAKLLGAEVTTTASPRGEDLVRQMGADHVIDYTNTELRDLSTRFDGVFDLVGGDSLESCFEITKPGGTVISVAGLPEPTTASKDLQAGLKLKLIFWAISFKLRRLAAKANVNYRFLLMHASGEQLKELVEFVDAGKLRPVIDKKFAFENMVDAMAYLEAGRAKGKVIVEMNAGD